jgi:stage V sporulation protein S
MNYYLHRGRVSDQQTEIGSPEAAATFHIGLMMVLQERQRRRRLEELEAQETRVARGSNGRVIRAGKNTKVSVLAEQIIERILDQGIVELEAVGAGAVNQAVKAVARARQTLEPGGYTLVIIPELMQVPLGHGSQTVVHLTVVDVYAG